MHNDEQSGRHDRTLRDAILEEQRARWNEGDRVLVEEYLARNLGLRDDAKAVLDLIYQEFHLRRLRGEAPAPEEHIERFPEWSEVLVRQFAVDEAMRSNGREWEVPASKGASAGKQLTQSTPGDDSTPGVAVEGYENPP